MEFGEDIIEKLVTDKTIFENDYFTIKENEHEYYIKFKTDKALMEVTGIHDYPHCHVLEVTVVKE